MPSFETQRRVPFSAQQMYALVADVERYPEFLPLCTGLVVNSRKPLGAIGEELTARMSVGYKSIAENFITKVSLKPDEQRIDVTYLDGPFRHLDNRWRFIDLPTADATSASLVDFYITYEFRSPMLGLLVGTMFDQAFRKFAEAFEQRAREVYGAPKRVV
ncbi:MAG: ubiquinone-binding protein [Hyphomicrobium sp.]|nr:MAG: ubiquinone-binding protein [Hyphomicrobium sp.]PPC99685.1 MAG: ubiquinone-binding protein [Hyphomicrobium sp.]